MVLPEHPLKQTATMALFSILAVVMLVAVASNQGSTGAASGYHVPRNECTAWCQELHGPGWIGTPIGHSGAMGNYCVCKHDGYQYRPDDFYR